jgi:hypothetical protein
VAAIASWIAVTALSRANGHPAHEALKRKVIGFLKRWRGRFGQGKLDEVKQLLLVEMEKYRKDRKLTDQELHERIERLFDEINH